jgi:polar amino acid transport system substrate-binding protein
VLPKDQADSLGAAIEGALEALIADGTYKTVLAKWGVDAGGITSPAVNPTA